MCVLRVARTNVQHTADQIASDNWNRPYSREAAGVRRKRGYVTRANGWLGSSVFAMLPNKSAFQANCSGLCTTPGRDKR